MSARSASHGGLRRSSSLTTLSRPSIGLGQRGAQRVSGAAFDSKVKNSGGNSGSRTGPMGSTLRRYGSQSAISQMSASKQRLSSVGGSSCLKDTRPFSDRLYRERKVCELVQFLTSHRYPHQVNLKGANGPSTADFRKIFEFLVCHLQPNFKLGQRLDEAVMTVLRSHCYPFTISKSHLSTIGVQHTWPPILAALSFLRTCIESVEQVDIDRLLTSIDGDDQPSEQLQVYHKFVEAAYASFLSGVDEEYQLLFVELEKKIESSSLQSAELEAQEQETDHNRQILAQLESQPNELMKLDNDNETLLLDIEKLEKYVAGLAHYNSEKEANLQVLADQLQQRVSERDALTSEVQKKTYIASNQRVSGIDAQRINSQLSDLKSQLSQADKELANLDTELNAEEKLYSQEKMSLVAGVAECNRMAQMLQLIPSSIADAANFDYEMKPHLTQAESIRFETTIMPSLQMLSQHMMEKRRQRDEEVAKMKEAMEQYREMIADCTDKSTTVRNSITAVDNRLEQAKDAHVLKIQHLQSQIDQHNAIITSRNTHGALDSCRQLLQSDKDRLEAERKSLQEKQDAYCSHLKQVAEQILEYKRHVKETLPKIFDEFLALLPKEVTED